MSEHPWVAAFRRRCRLRRRRLEDVLATPRSLRLAHVAGWLDYVPVLASEAFVVAQQQPLTIRRFGERAELIALIGDPGMRQPGFNARGEWTLAYMPFWLRLLPYLPAQEGKGGLYEIDDDDGEDDGADARAAIRARRTGAALEELSAMRSAESLGASCKTLGGLPDALLDPRHPTAAQVPAPQEPASIRQVSALDQADILPQAYVLPENCPFAERALLHAMLFSWRRALRPRHVPRPVSFAGHIEDPDRTVDFWLDPGDKIVF